ncbi:MAG TPA: TolC family protein [Gemmataceae bacterium]|nr:TolC family protein [Gemmataceae bacterium]
MTARHSISIIALLLTAGLAFGQGAPKKDAAPKESPKPAPGSLEDTLEKALRNSADIKAAEAKVQNAEAELNRVRQQVLTRATTLHTDLNLARRMLEVAESALSETDRLVKMGAANREQILAARAVVEKHRGEIEKLEVELKALRGEFALKGALSVAFDPDGRRLSALMWDGTVRLWDPTTGAAIGDLAGSSLGASLAQAKAPGVQAPMADRIKKALDQELQIETEIPVADALRAILETSKVDIPVRELLPKNLDGTVALKGKLTVGAWIQAIEDTDASLRVVVRDYGLLFTTRDRVPDGALRVQDLWKGNYAQPSKPDPKRAEKK